MEVGGEIPGRKERVQVVMAAPDPRLQLSAYFQPILSEKTAETAQGFEYLPMSSYYLGHWGNILQVLEAEALETTMLSLDGIKRENGY